MKYQSSKDAGLYDKLCVHNEVEDNSQALISSSVQFKSPLYHLLEDLSIVQIIWQLDSGLYEHFILYIEQVFRIISNIRRP